MNGKPDYDILVVGGGMVGSTAALGLARQGWRVGLIEAATWDSLAAPVAPINSVTDFEPRFSAISAASQSLLKQLDVWPAIAGQTSNCLSNDWLAAEMALKRGSKSVTLLIGATGAARLSQVAASISPTRHPCLASPSAAVLPTIPPPTTRMS